MEQHGKNPEQLVIAIIPARYASTRLEGKLLLSIGGKPLILHTLEQAKKAKNINQVIVATDSELILQVVQQSGNRAILTSPNHQSGSDRIAEVVETLPENSIIVNVQGDEPMIPPGTIEKAVEVLLNDESLVMSTTCEKIESPQDVFSPDVVKVVTDENDFALYFSRSPIPFPREAVKQYGTLEKALHIEPGLIANFRKHTGLYVYRREFLLEYTKMRQSNLEKVEMLEQLRVLENGYKIKVIEVEESSIGVDTREDFERVRQILESRKSFIIRRAILEDIPQIAKVHVESWQKSFRGIAPEKYLSNLSVERREKAFRERFYDEDYQMFVAETEKRKIVGFVDFGKGRDFQFEFQRELYAIYLLQEFQGKGIGAELFKVGIRNLQALQISPYRKFYEKMGGKIIGQSIYKLGDEDFETLYYGWADLGKI